MSTYTVVRGKRVIFGSIELQGNADGSLHIMVGGQQMSLTGDEASALHDLMSDLMEWSSQAGTTEGQLNRQAEEFDASAATGREDDLRAHEGR